MIAQQIKIEPYVYIYQISLNEMKAITDKSKVKYKSFQDDKIEVADENS